MPRCSLWWCSRLTPQTAQALCRVFAEWYVEMFRNATALTALRNTLVLAVTSALISIIIGTAAAVGINAMKNGG